GSRCGPFPDAINAFGLVIQHYPDTPLSMDSYLKIGESYTRMNQLESAEATLQALIDVTDKADIKDEANYRIGWIHVDLASWEEARSYFGNISEGNRERYRLKRLLVELGKEEMIVRKNPRLAGFLSILPGGGYAYLGRYQDAATAFLLNTGLIVAAATAFKDDNPALGGVISFVGSGFYFGNIFGAVSSTHKYNKDQTGRFIDRLKANTRINLLADRQYRGVILALQVAF
ncbi:MAG: tetratricopeptide repeat protein, partial [Desulfobacterales bacterium]